MCGALLCFALPIFNQTHGTSVSEDARPEDRLQHDGNGTSSREIDKAYLKSFEYGKDKMVVRGSHGIKDKRTSIISILTKGCIIDSL